MKRYARPRRAQQRRGHQTLKKGKKMNIDELTFGQINEIQSLTGELSSLNPCREFFAVGKAYFIRTVTHHFTGKLVGFSRGGLELIMKNCAWIADDGRFTDAMESGNLNEVEIYPSDGDVLINRETIIDAIEWKHSIPDSQK